jgi:hypothetical protein
MINTYPRLNTRIGTITMTSNNNFIFLTISGMALTVSASAQAPTAEQLATPPAASDAAEGSLRAYTLLHPSAPGGEKVTATIGNALHDYYIRLDELKAWDGRDAKRLLHPSGELIYSIKVNGITASEVTVANREGQWKVIAFGPDNEAKSRSAYFETFKVKTLGEGDANVFQVTIPALNATFLAGEFRGSLFLSPIKSQPSFGLEAGKSEPATDILIRLQPAAKKVDPDKPG